MSQKAFNKFMNDYISRISGKRKVKVVRSKHHKTVDEEHPGMSESGVTVVHRDENVLDYLSRALKDLIKAIKKVLHKLLIKHPKTHKHKEEPKPEPKEEVSEAVSKIADEEFEKEEEVFEEEVKEASVLERIKSYLFRKKEEPEEEFEEDKEEVNDIEEDAEKEEAEEAKEEKKPKGPKLTILQKISCLFETKQTVEEESDELSEEAKEMIKSLINVNISALKRLPPKELDKFKSSDDFVKFKEAVDKYKDMTQQ